MSDWDARLRGELFRIFWFILSGGKTCLDARFLFFCFVVVFFLTRSAGVWWHTLEQKKRKEEKKKRHSAASAEQAGFRFKSSGRGRRVTESAGERRRCIRETETSAN